MWKLYFGSSLAMLLIAGALGVAYGADYTPVTTHVCKSGAAKLADDTG